MFQSEQRRHLKRNYLAYALDGGLVMGAMSFVHGGTVLPVLAQKLGAPPWLIAFLPNLIMIGLVLPPLFAAHFIEKLDRMKPWLLVTGFFQRLPFLVAALGLFLWADSHPTTVLLLVAAAPFVSGLLGGLGLSASMELASRIIPGQRLASSNALRFLVAGLMGIAAGFVIEQILQRWPGFDGYGMLHLIASAFLILSYAALCTIREPVPPQSHPKVQQSFFETLKEMPQLVREDRRFLRYLNARFFSVGIFVVLPFLSIHAMEVTGEDEAFIGSLVMVQMIGAFLGNIVTGWWGDRGGTKGPMLTARFGFFLVALLAILATTPFLFYLIFFIHGVCFNMNNVATSTMNVEICPAARRRTYLSIATGVMLPAFILSALLGGTLKEFFTGITGPAVASMVLTLLSFGFLWGIRDPRHGGG